MDLDASFGAWLAQRRHVLGLSRPQLARQVNCAAITLRKIEEDARRPSQDLAAQLANHLSILPEERATFIRVARGDIPVAWLPPADRPATVAPPPVLGARPTRLPIPPTPLLGRAQEVAAVREMLLRDEVRLLTLTGPPGIGKTRLSLQVANELQAAGADGVAFVLLAPISDPDLVLTTIAQTLGVTERAGQSLRDGLTASLRELRMLVVLDNFEHLLPAAPQLAELLAAVPGLTLLVTSRVTLRLSGEHRFAVPPLGLPPPTDATWGGRGGDSGAAIAQYAAVELFVQRARAVLPAFGLTVENTAAVAEICRHLDGLPLAIELAAVRITLFSPQALLTRLSHRLGLLTTGALDLPERQHTLRRAIAWSFDLLDGEEQALFRRLSIFVGGFTLAAADAVVGTRGGARGDLPLVDGLERIINASLLEHHAGGDGEPRFGMMETIREYALECLDASGDGATVRRQHARYYRQLAETAEAELTGAQQAAWLTRLDVEHANLRAALAWTVEHWEQVAMARLSGALWRFWWLRGHLSEGRRWFAAALAARTGVPAALQAKVLRGAGILAYREGAYAAASTLFEESLALYRALDDTAGIAWSLNDLGSVAYRQGQYAAARALHEESLALHRALGDTAGIARGLTTLGSVAYRHGEYTAARALHEESLALHRVLGDTRGIAIALTNLGHVAYREGDYAAAHTFYEESLALHRALGDTAGIAGSLKDVGSVAHQQGDYAAARALHEESLALVRELGDKQVMVWPLTSLGSVAYQKGEPRAARALLAESLALAHELGDTERIADALEGMAAVASAQGAAARAVRLAGAAAALRVATGASPEPVAQAQLDQQLAPARQALDADAQGAAWTAGQALPLEQAIAYALDEIADNAT